MARGVEIVLVPTNRPHHAAQGSVGPARRCTCRCLLGGVREIRIWGTVEPDLGVR